MRDWFSSSGSGPGRFENTLHGILIGALVVGFVWLTTVYLQGWSDDPAQTTRSAGSSDQAKLANAGHSVGSSPTGSTNDKRALRAESLSNCHTVYKDQAQPLKAAATAMNQWQVHIGAMNQLVLGVITLQQANQFWNQTRNGAEVKLHAFRAAVAPLKQPSTLCPAPPRSSPARGKLVGCERAVAARMRVLNSARVALGTWAMHVTHMEMLRTGKMSPQKAQTMWLHSWHEGQREVTQYEAATRAARAKRC